jgi:RNA polymerase sigma-70 factor (ECF subfamily)
MATRSLEVNGTRFVHALERTEDGSADDRFATAFIRQRPRLRRLVAGMGFDPADADDILQDVFVEASQRPGDYRGDPDAERWLMRVTVNRCLLEYRRRQRFRRAATEILRRRRRAEEIGSPANVDGAVARIEEIESMRAALRELDADLGAALVLRHFCGLNATQIGEILQLPAATVRSRLRTARLMLAERLMKKGVQP